MIFDEADSRTDSQHDGQQHNNFVRPDDQASGIANQAWHTLVEFSLRNEASSESLAKQSALAVIEAVSILHLPAGRLAGLKAAVESAALNAFEHRDRLHPELPVSLCVYTSEKADLPGTEQLPGTSRGWGFFFIEKLSETMSSEDHPVVQLFLYQEGNI
jgi:hypothetical protein